MRIASARDVTRLETFVLRLLMILMAATVAFVGYSVLTSPFIIPFTIALWMGAVGMFALGVWGHLPSE